MKNGDDWLAQTWAEISVLPLWRNSSQHCFDSQSHPSLSRLYSLLFYFFQKVYCVHPAPSIKHLYLLLASKVQCLQEAELGWVHRDEVDRLRLPSLHSQRSRMRRCLKSISVAHSTSSESRSVGIVGKHRHWICTMGVPGWLRQEQKVSNASGPFSSLLSGSPDVPDLWSLQGPIARTVPSSAVVFLGPALKAHTNLVLSEDLHLPFFLYHFFLSLSFNNILLSRFCCCYERISFVVFTAILIRFRGRWEARVGFSCQLEPEVAPKCQCNGLLVAKAIVCRQILRVAENNFWNQCFNFNISSFYNSLQDWFCMNIT